MKKGIKILAGVTAFVLMGGLLWFANGLVGNPISKQLAKQATEKYVEAYYPNQALEVADVFYSFKDCDYHVQVQSATSVDTHFGVVVSALGKVEWDSYEQDVVKRWNTFERIDASYREQVEAVFDSDTFPYASEISFGGIMGRMSDEVREEDSILFPVYGLIIDDLELDYNYDIEECGKTAGNIVFYTSDEDVSIKRAGEILLDIKRILDEHNLPFYTIDFVLEKPRKEDEKPNPNGVAIRVQSFLYRDLYEEGLEERLEVAANALETYYQEQDAQKMMR